MGFCNLEVPILSFYDSITILFKEKYNLSEYYEKRIVMTIKEKTIREVESLKPDEVRLIYDIIQSLKRRSRRGTQNENHYLKVREALKNIRGSLSEDIRIQRHDRI